MDDQHLAVQRTPWEILGKLYSIQSSFGTEPVEVARDDKEF